MPEENEVQSLDIGKEFAHYLVVERLGVGGMGEVYLASDSKLGRKVALKILPAKAMKNADVLQRFEQEARAASALNHPNIAHIYEIGESGGLHFIAMEYVEGVSLDRKIGRQPLPVADIVRIGTQIADALDEAHANGVIHRDMKSANVMLDRRERVKVLDFGLAKVSQAIESEESTRVKTRSGVVMGTVSYMSPEQALGRDVDARTDVWSLGVLLYEMATGRLPFRSESMTETIEKIVHSQPEAVARLNYDVPPELELIIKKALRKNRDERFSTVRDMLVDLRSLGRELDLTETSLTPNSQALRSDPAVSGHGTDRNAADTQLFGASGNDTVSRSMSGSQYLSGEIKKHKFAAVAGAVIVIAVLAGFAYGIYSFFLNKNIESRSPSNEPAVKVQRLTGDGKTRGAEISPDGKFLAYIRTEGGERSIWIKQILTNSNIQVAKSGELDDFGNPVFSPDGNFLYFYAQTKSDEAPSIYRVPTLGGTPTRAFTNVFAPRFSADGRQVSFNRFDLASTESSVWVANSDGTNERKIASRVGMQYFDDGAAWSPDGKILAAVTGDDSISRDPNQWISFIPVEGGEISELAKWSNITGLVWHPSGDSLIVVASDSPMCQTQIWEVAYPSGTARRLTNNLNGHSSVSITADGKSIVTGEIYARSSVWVSPDLKAENAKQVMPASGDTWGIGWTPDNRLVYVSDLTGDAEIWIMDADGANARPLTNDKIFKTTPVASPDGKYIVFTSSIGGGQLYRIDMNGGNSQVLASSAGADNPDISPDGIWVIFSAYVGGFQRIMRVPITGGDPQPLTDYHSTEPRFSRDGTQFACFTANEKTLDWTKLAIVPAEGGPPIKVFDAPRNMNIGRGPVWTPDDKGITMVVAPGELQNLWLQPVDGGPGKMMTNFPVPGIARREYSRDGNRIAIVRAEGFGNVIMITDFR